MTAWGRNARGRQRVARPADRVGALEGRLELDNHVREPEFMSTGPSIAVPGSRRQRVDNVITSFFYAAEGVACFVDSAPTASATGLASHTVPGSPVEIRRTL
jgi:hypothetical protein